MIHVTHLLWICPLSAFVGFLIFAVLAANDKRR